MSYINQISTALPIHRHSQPEIARYMSAHFGKGSFIERVYAESAIDYRYSVLPDFSPGSFPKLFIPDYDPSVTERMNLFDKEAPVLGGKALQPILDKEDITHLITVSCTGIAAPGLELQLVKYLGLSPAIPRYTVNFMGCYAAFSALRLADMICHREKEARVAVVCVELCTIHFQQSYSFDSLAPAALFGDGSAAVLVSNRKEGLELNSFHSQLVPEAEDQMTWQVGQTGFLMHLGTGVPKVIAKKIAELMKESSNGNKIRYWAVHPGGRKILDSFAEGLDLPPRALDHSYRVLKNYGNMSSPTILFVLDEIMKEKEEGEVLACGFGPGLSVETMRLRK